ncbi:E3 ubiquitin-protein ligase MARCH4-like [Huso huso]|uniref:RING-type E3 ubiquitin transferase n=1 Tax=Huso huso TaxID=61971 RepID=A0ABR0ZFM3_HUSHU
MLLAAGFILWCCGLLSHRQMLRHQALVKGRCCVLFSDVKVFLLRPSTPSAPSPLFLPMSGGNTESHGNGVLGASSIVDSNNTLTSVPSSAAWQPPPTGGAASTEEEEGRGTGVWGGAAGAAEHSVSLISSTSSDDFYKGKGEDGQSLTSCTDSGTLTPLCRICFQGPDQGELLSPCHCKGSVRSTHQPCLIKWVSERGSWSCELCYYKYHVIAISTKNPLQWQAISLTVIEKVQIAAAVLGTLFLIASISWLFWSSFSPSAKWQRQDLLFQICYGMYGFMDIVCIGLIIHEGPSVFRIFKRWQAVNQQWKVLNYDKFTDSSDQKARASSRNLVQPTQSSNQIRATSSSLTPGTAATVPVTPATTTTTATSAMGFNQNNAPGSGPPLSNHCAYSILHLLSHLRQQESRGHGSHSNSNRELVMRVTTV